MTATGRLRIADLLRSAAAAVLALVLLQPLAGPTRAEVTPAAPPPPPHVAAFEDFILIAGPICQVAPAETCIDAGWRFADRDSDDHLSLDEALDLRRSFETWAEWKKPQIRKRERAVLAISRLALRLVDIEGVVTGYDSDGDGRLTRAELLVDVTLDERTLGEILTDREATDWTSIAERLGPAATFLGALGAPTE